MAQNIEYRMLTANDQSVVWEMLGYAAYESQEVLRAEPSWPTTRPILAGRETWALWPRWTE